MITIGKGSNTIKVWHDRDHPWQFIVECPMIMHGVTLAQLLEIGQDLQNEQLGYWATYCDRFSLYFNRATGLILVAGPEINHNRTVIAWAQEDGSRMIELGREIEAKAKEFGA